MYEALIVPDDPTWEEFSHRVQVSLGTLKLLGATQCLPVLMASYHKFSKEDFDKVVWLMTVMAVRYSLVCSFRTGALEIKYAEIARDISNGKHKRAGAVFRQMSELYPSDQTFKAAFEVFQVGSAKHARFLLRELESQHGGGMAPEADPEVLNVEHVAPKARNQHWRNVGELHGDPYDSWISRLGNLVLLHKKENQGLGGAAFADKRAVFLRSNVGLTRIVGECDGWTTIEIDKRQQLLSELAVARWRY